VSCNDVKLIEGKESVLVIERRAKGPTVRASALPVIDESISKESESLSKLVVKWKKPKKIKTDSLSSPAHSLTRLPSD